MKRYLSVFLVALFALCVPALHAETTCSITSPADGDVLIGSIDIVGTAASGFGVTWEVLIDGNFLNDGGGAPGSAIDFPWDTTQVTDGPHVISLDAYGQGFDTSTAESVINVNVNNGGQGGNGSISGTIDYPAGEMQNGNLHIMVGHGLPNTW